MTNEKLFKMSFASIYPHYLKKVETKGHTKAELDEIIRWLTGYTQEQFEEHLSQETDLENFYGQAKLNPNRSLITGRICGVKVEEITDPTMQAIRYLDKLIDELAHDKPMEKILRK
jgi:hypothetical protein